MPRNDCRKVVVCLPLLVLGSRARQSSSVLLVHSPEIEPDCMKTHRSEDVLQECLAGSFIEYPKLGTYPAGIGIRRGHGKWKFSTGAGNRSPQRTVTQLPQNPRLDKWRRGRTSVPRTPLALVVPGSQKRS
jgi:hypothetical protein